MRKGIRENCPAAEAAGLLINLRAIDESNYEQCFHLKASVENENFVDSVIYSLAEAWVYYEDTRPFAIYKGEEMVSAFQTAWKTGMFL